VSSYKLYFLDPARRDMQRSVDLECSDDAQAIEFVKVCTDSSAIELWQQRRIVKKFSPASVQSAGRQVL
jgi:hypothetical protein